MKAKLPIVYFFLTLLFVVVSGTAFAQNGPLTYSHSFPVGSGTVVSADQLGNIYLLDQKRNILKLDSLAKPITVFSPPTRGRIASIDAWNPMKILAFYQDRQELLLLDRFLRPISTASLQDYNLDGSVRAAALASDDGFWLFNESNFSLAKLNIQLRKVTSETPLNLILDRERFDVRMIHEYQNLVYLLDFNGGIYVFDNLGNYKKKLLHTGVSYMNFRDSQLYFVKDAKLHFVDLYTSQETTVDLPLANYTSALVHGSSVYLFTPSKGLVYTW